MSTLIPTLKALDIVRECCAKVNPQSQLIGQIQAFVEAVKQASPFPTPPSEAGATLAPGLTTAVTVVGRVLRVGKVILVKAPEKPPAVPQTITLSLKDWSKLVGRLTDIANNVERLNLCAELMSCVAKGFRLSQLGQGEEHARKKLVERGYAVHWIRGNIPRRVQHTTRK